MTILGPILFSFNMLPLSFICQTYNVAYHCNADDTQLYLLLKAGDGSQLDVLIYCLSEIKLWMAQNLFQLNEAKTECKALGHPLNILDCLGPLASNVHKQANNLGGVFDSECYGNFNH